MLETSRGTEVVHLSQALAMRAVPNVLNHGLCSRKCGMRVGEIAKDERLLRPWGQRKGPWGLSTTNAIPDFGVGVDGELDFGEINDQQSR